MKKKDRGLHGNAITVFFSGTKQTKFFPFFSVTTFDAVAAAPNNAEIFFVLKPILVHCVSVWVCVCVDKFFDKSITVLIKLRTCNRNGRKTYTHTNFLTMSMRAVLITIIRFRMAHSLSALFLLLSVYVTLLIKFGSDGKKYSRQQHRMQCVCRWQLN